MLVLPGTYVEDLDLLGKSLDVRSTAGIGQTTLMAATATSVLTAVNVANGRLEGFSVRDGRGTSFQGNTYGGGLLLSGSTFELQDCDFIENHAALGGAVCALNDSSLSIVGCALREGDAHRGAGLYASDSAVVAMDTLIRANSGSPANPGNFLSYRGTGVYTENGATLQMFDCEVSACRPQTSYYGAGM